MKFLKKSFITGMVLTLPTCITLFCINVLLRHIGEPASKILFYWLDDISIRNSSVLKFLLSIISIVIVVASIVIVGFLSNLFLGRLMISYLEKLINRVPLVSGIYKTVKQIIETFGKNGQSAFSKTVLIEYPKEGSYAVGFLSSEVEGEVQIKTGQVVVNVFIPTTPNPTSGFLLMIPKENVTELEMSVSDGMKLIISGGMVVPPYKQQRKKKNG